MMLTEVKTHDNKVVTTQSFVNMDCEGGKHSLQQTVGFTQPDGNVLFYLTFNLPPLCCVKINALIFALISFYVYQ